MAEDGPLKMWRNVGGGHAEPRDITKRTSKANTNQHPAGKKNAPPVLVPSVHNLAELFPGKFEYHEEDQKHITPTAQRKATAQVDVVEQRRREAEGDDYIDENEATAEQTGSSSTSPEGKKEGEKPGTFALGTDCSGEFPKAESKNVMVLREGKEFQIVRKESPDDPLNTEGALQSKASVTKFIDALPS